MYQCLQRVQNRQQEKDNENAREEEMTDLGSSGDVMDRGLYALANGREHRAHTFRNLAPLAPSGVDEELVVEWTSSNLLAPIRFSSLSPRT